ncbi:MAG: efflux RND transporter periplasmic adaptor subunit [Bacteroidia bacterium]|nr:efflux RND transporter periplasmic adaptor subunit [Bacteroidia bacterium]
MLLKKICIGLFSIAIITGCADNPKADENANIFPVTKVVKMDTTTFTDYVTEIHAVQNVEIRARVSGYLEKNWVDEGAQVSKGQLLFTINSQEYQQELAKAKAQYKSALADLKAAELELKNVTQLANNKIVSVTELELAKNRLEAQKAKMEEALAHQTHASVRLLHTEIRAPFDGIINRIPNKMGSLIEEGTLLTLISSSDEVYAYFDVSEREYLNFAKRMRNADNASRNVSLILADGQKHEYEGIIETMEGAIDAATGTIAFRARFKNSGKLIKHGASGKVRVYYKHKQVLVIPQKVTFEIQDKMYVYVLDDKNRISSRNIEIAQRMPHLYIIQAGLIEGEKILYEGIQLVKEGQEIKPEYISLPKIIQSFNKKG